MWGYSMTDILLSCILYQKMTLTNTADEVEYPSSLNIL